MTWEYCIAQIGHNAQSVTRQNELGAQGWEAVTIDSDGGYLIMKKPKNEDTTATHN
jgi:hypothetical protein